MYGKLISVIVPIYNVEKYLDKCIESIANQTYKNLEIILVDDGSPDNCPRMCDYWASRDERIKVIHKKNGGISSARNVGFEASTGEYISFIDSDDWVDENTFESALNMLETNDCDISVFSLLTEFETVTKQNITDYDMHTCNQKEFYHLMLNSDNICGYACNKLFKRELISNLRFDESLFVCEDFLFCAEYVTKCKSAVYTSAKFYHYRQRLDSATRDYNYNPNKTTSLDSYERIMQIYSEYDNDDIYKLERNYLKMALNFKGRMKLSNVKDDDVSIRLERIISKYYSRIMKNPNNDIKVKLNVAFTRLFPSILLRVKQLIISKKRGLNND